MSDPITPSGKGHLAVCPVKDCTWETHHVSRAYLSAKYAIHTKTHEKKGATR